MADSHPPSQSKGGRGRGCPLSSALFALVMEPLAEALQKSSGVSRICVGSIVKKLALYADDLILFLRDPGPSPSAALQFLGRFTALSGLKTNWSKSLILPIDPRAKKKIVPTSPLQWATTIRYLGINISFNVHNFSKLNLSPELQWCKQKLKAWSNLPLSLIGKINLIKILPGLLYNLRHSLVWIPKTFSTIRHNNSFFPVAVTAS